MKIILSESQLSNLLLNEIDNKISTSIDNEIKESVNDLMLSINKDYPELKLTIDKFQPIINYLITNKNTYITSINNKSNNSLQMCTMFYNFIIKFISDLINSNLNSVKRFLIRQSFKGRENFKNYISSIVFKNLDGIINLSNYGLMTWIPYSHTQYFDTVYDWKHGYEKWFIDRKKNILSTISELITNKIYV